MSTFKFYRNGQWNYVNGVITGDTLPIGSQIPYGSTTPPVNWLVCDGSAVSRTTYAELFAVIGTSYGAGDGSTTFNLPNKKGRNSVGYDSEDTDFNTIGKKGGSKTHTLTTNELPSHNHTISADIYAYTPAGGSAAGVVSQGGAGSPVFVNYSASNTGGGQAHNIEDPFEVDCWIIKAFQSAGVVAEVSDTYSQSTTNTYSCNYVNNKTKNAYNTSQLDNYSCDYMNGQLSSLLTKHESYIQLGLNSRYDRTTQSWTNMIINYDRTDFSNGNLTRSGNGVVIGAGISKVLAIGVCVDGANQSGNEHDTGFIVNNGNRYGHTYSTAKNELRSQTIASIIPVNQGDVIQHYVNTGGTITVTQYETSRFIVIAIA